MKSTKRGGIYIEISADVKKLQEALKNAEAMAGNAAQGISNSLTGALSPTQIKRNATQITSAMQQMKTSAKALKADLSEYDVLFRRMGREIGLSGKELQKYVQIQQQALKTNLIKEHESAVKKLNRALGETGEQAKSAGFALNGIAKQLVGLFSAYKLLDTARQAFSNAAEFETMGVALQNVGHLAGYSELKLQAYENQLRKLGIAGIEARQTLTQLVQAQIDIEKAPGLARIAQDAAVIGRTNSSEAFSRMIQGIQSGQVEILRNIGISVNFQQAYKNMAKELGTTTEQLSEAEKAQARVNAVMEAGTNIAGTYEASLDTVGKKLSSLQRVWDDFLTDLGASFAGNGVVDLVTSGLNRISETIVGLQIRGEFSNSLGFVGASDFESYSRVLTGSVTQMRETLQAIRFVKENMDATIGTIHNVAQALADSLLPSTRAAGGGFDDARKSLTEYTKSTEAAKLESRDLERSQMDAALSMLEVEIRAKNTAAGILEAARSLPFFGGAVNSSVEQLREEAAELQKELTTLSSRVRERQTAEDKPRGGLRNTDRERESMLKQLQSDIQRLTLSEREYREELVRQQVVKAEGLNIDRAIIQQWQELQIAEFDKAHFGEAAQALKDFEKEYQSTMGNVAGLTQSIASEMDKYREAVEAANLSERQRQETLMRIAELEQRRLLEVSRDASAGVRLSFVDYQRDATNAAKTVYDAMTNTMTGMEDALVDFVKTGKLSFSSLVDSIISDLARLAIQQSVTGPLFNALGTAVGSYFGGYTPTMEGTLNTDWSSWSSGAFANAKGGIYPHSSLADYTNSIVDNPTLFAFAKGGAIGLMGEAGAEAIMPLVKTPSGDLGVRAEGASGSTPQVNIQVIDQRGSDAPPVEVQQSRNANGGTDIRVIVRAEVLNTFKSGAANGVMRNVFGLKPLAGGN